MRKNVLLGFVLILTGFMPVLAQFKPTGIQAQVKERFDYQIYKETFDSSAKIWPVLSNGDNLLIMQEGEYILQRKSKISPFAVMGEFETPFTDFRFVTSIKIVKSTEGEGSVGCIFMAQPGGKGGFVFEINLKQEYRLRQITSSGYAYLTGSAKDGGWVKTSLLKPVNMSNLFEVRTFDNKYDLYLNNNVLLTYSEIAYSSGNLGFIIGPGTMGKIDFVYIFSNSKKQVIGDEQDSLVSDNSKEADLIALAESVIDLKSQLNKVQKENDELKERMEFFKGLEAEQTKMKAAYDVRISLLNAEIKKREKSIDSLNTLNAELNKYKDMVKGNESGDVVISLSRNLKAEKLRADELAKQNQSLRDSIRVLQIGLKKTSSGNKITDDTLPSAPPKDDNVFVLPKEN